MKLVGKKFQVSTYVNKETFDRIESLRGLISRSCFVSMVLEDVLGDEGETKEGENSNKQN